MYVRNGGTNMVRAAFFHLGRDVHGNTGHHGNSDSASFFIQHWDTGSDDMCECFDSQTRRPNPSSSPEPDGTNVLQYIAMPNNLISTGLYFVICKCTQWPTNLFAVHGARTHFLLLHLYSIRQLPTCHVRLRPLMAAL